MTRRTRVDRRRSPGTTASPGGEWLGGRLAPPFFITDAEQPYRAQIALWLELPQGLIVGQEVTAPANVEGALGRVLLAALERPLIGPIRRPSRIRVADEALAAEVRAVVGDRIPVRVAPTPELDEVLESMIESMPSDSDEQPSYLEGGRISEEIVAEFFGSAEVLYRVAPWRVATDDQVVIPGRNDPCPCGSGRKYKRCHLRDDERTRAEESRGSALHALDQGLVDEISAFAFAHFGIEARGWVRDFDDPMRALALAMPWSVYHFCVRGRPAFEWFLEESRRRPSAGERRWLEAQRASWLSVWEVSEVRAGEGLMLRDLLTEEERCVQEILATQTLVKRDCILARVVELDGTSVLGGTHPRPLPPVVAAEVVRRVRGRLRRKRAVAPDLLRHEKLGRYLIRRWEEAVVELDMRRSRPPRLRNTDGEPLILTTDHYDIVPGKRGDVAARIAALEGVLPPDPDDADPSYDLLRSSTPGGSPARGDTLLGSLRIARDRLRVETNSIARADALRRRVEQACGDLVRHRTREHVDPLSEPLRKEVAKRPQEAPRPEARQLVLEFKRSHYATWLDEPLPALGGKSPRAAVRSPAGRAAVDTLLKEMENLEERLPMDERFDFSEFRRRLELDE